MKKIITLLLIIIVPFAVSAQNYVLPGGNGFPHDFIHIPATVLAMYFIIMFLITIVKTILDYRLKSKMIDKGVPDEVVKQFLQPNQRDRRNQAIKWCLLLAGLGLGLTFVSLYTPLGIHSVAIMAFSLSASFLGYYLFINRSSDKTQS